MNTLDKWYEMEEDLERDISKNNKKQELIMNTKSFYMVYVEGQNSPTYRHETLSSAEAEAKRLAKMLNRKTFVLCSIKSFDFVEEDCRPNNSDKLPF